MLADCHGRLLSANSEIRTFLERVAALVHGTGDLDASDLNGLGRLLETMAPEIARVSGGGAVENAIQDQIQMYTDNLRALQAALNQIRCVMLARREQIEAAQQHMSGLRGWVNAYRQTS
jgi:hypothetical protein